MESQVTLLKDRYSIIKLLGRGGMGEVFLAEDKLLSRQVAVKKVIYGDNEFLLKAAEKEAMVLARLQHQCLPKVLDYFNEGDAQYIVMEYITGKDLGEMLRLNNGPFSIEKIWVWVDTLLDVIQYLHNQLPPVVHRDIKPQNIKITDEGKLFLLDFGLVKDTPTRVRNDSLSLSVYGYSQSYAPLEQINGDPTSVQTDVYELCATLYHLLTNIKPADALDRATKKIENKPDPLRPAHEANPNVPLELSQVLEAGLQLSCDNRIKSIKALAELLNQTKGKKRERIKIEIDEDRKNVGTITESSTVASASGFLKGKRKLYLLAAVAALPLIIGIIFAARFLLKNPDYERMQGVWEYTDPDDMKWALIVDGDSVIRSDSTTRYKFTLDSSKSPKQITVLSDPEGKVESVGIFELSNQQLKIAFAEDKNNPPKEFAPQNYLLFSYIGKSSNLAPVDSNYLNGLKTWNYCIAFNKISKRLNSLLPKINSEGTPDEQISKFKTALASFEKARSDINQLPVSGVDPELTSYVSKLALSIDQVKGVIKEIIPIIEDVKAWVAKNQSDETAGRRFGDWLFSNENGVDQELEEEKQQIQRRMLSLQNRYVSVQEEFNRLMAQQLELRSSLSKKYNREFPQL